MPLKNNNAVAVDRRMDLASLFCTIARHGPAVALAVIAMVSVLAGFIIYRTVRGKRRRATAAAAAAAADSGGESPGAERDESGIRPGQKLSPEESHSSVESTNVSDEGYMKEDTELLQSDRKIRHRRAAATVKKPPPYSPPDSDNQTPDHEHTSSDDTEEITVAQDSDKVVKCYAEEASHNVQCGTYTVAEVEVVECADDSVQDVIEESHDDDSCLKEPELINDKSHEEEEKVSFETYTAEEQEDENVTIERDVSDEQTRQEGGNFPYASNNQVCFSQTPHNSENVDDDRPQDNNILGTNTAESALEEPIIYSEDAPVICICYGKEEEFQEENHHPDSTYYSDYSSYHFSTEEEKKNEGEEAEEEWVDKQLRPRLDENWPTKAEQEPNLPSSRHDQCDYVTDKVMPPIQDIDEDDDEGLVGKVTEEAIDEDYSLKAAERDSCSLQSEKQQLQSEPENENGLTSSGDDGARPSVADQGKKEMLISDGTTAHGAECESYTLHCLNQAVNVDDDLSVVNNDVEAEVLGIVQFSDSSLDRRQPQSEVKHEDFARPFDEDTEFAILGSDLTSLAKELKSETNETDTIVEENIDLHVPHCCKEQETGQVANNEALDMTTVVDALDTVTYDAETIIAPIMPEKISHHHVLSCNKDQPSVQMITNDVFDKSSVAAAPDTAENATASSEGEEIFCLSLPSIYQDQKIDYKEINETSEETRVICATDTNVCDNVCITTPVMSEEISRPHMLSFSQDQQSDQARKNEDFTEFTAGAASVMTEDLKPPMCQTHLSSVEQSEPKDNDKDTLSFPGVGEESGISSMTVSPELKDMVYEFGMFVENVAFPAMDFDPQSEERNEARNSLIADDVTVPVINQTTAGMVFGPYPSRFNPQPHSEHTDGAKYESFPPNEDTFGHEIEDSYHRAMEQVMVQIAANAMTTNEMKEQTDMKAFVEVVEMKEKEGVSIAKKVETEAEKEKEEDYEKTEISIMEATMDNNEWITDSNFQVLPWMNLSVLSLAQDQAKTNQLPTEDNDNSSHLIDALSVETEAPSFTEVKQTGTLSLVEENMENNKKVVAVQPMPQNVNVTFRVHYLTHSPYHTVAITGNQQELGNWKEFIPLERAKDGHWVTMVSLPTESHVEWKFVLMDKGEVCRWEECGNRLLDTGYGDDLIVHKWWGFL